MAIRMAIRERRKRIIYGMQNFDYVIKENCYCVDKTSFIEEVEDAHKYVFLSQLWWFDDKMLYALNSDE